MCFEDVEWKDGEIRIHWANGCDFWGNDYEKIQTAAEFCGSFCYRSTRCTHFAWNSYNGGTCFLKSGFAEDTRPTVAAQEYVCGYKEPPVRYFHKYFTNCLEYSMARR